MQSFALLLPVVVGAALLLSVLLVSFQRQNSVEITAAHRNEQHYSAESAVAVVFSSSADLHVLTSHSSLRPQRKLYPSVTRHGKDPAPFQLPLPLCGGDCDTNEEVSNIPC